MDTESIPSTPLTLQTLRDLMQRIEEQTEPWKAWCRQHAPVILLRCTEYASESSVYVVDGAAMAMPWERPTYSHVIVVHGHTWVHLREQLGLDERSLQQFVVWWTMTQRRSK